MNKATFAAGCFWGVEEAFRNIDGVASTAVGYSGGTFKNPSYEDVCSGKTGHAEVIQIEYDPNVISYEKLLDIFWQCHNPTTLNRQGPDMGTQYRSAIFYHDDNQKNLAVKSKEIMQPKFNNKIVTEITPASDFYRAEEYHQQYLAKHGRAQCHL